jgi:alpha-L-fucosidase 2
MKHILTMTRPAPAPEEGFLLGNGDLSVSIYSKPDRLIWRFGKGDVWDRRQDKDIDPEPMHIDELRRGVTEEGWVHDPETNVSKPTRGSADPERVKEVTQYGPPSYRHRPYPCPKPVGELAMNLPCDLHDMEITQTLSIEDATVDITLSWAEGVTIKAHCFVAPVTNALVINWTLEGQADLNRTWRGPGVWFSLYRWADPTPEEFTAQWQQHTYNDMFANHCGQGIKALPRPAVRPLGDRLILEQTFYPDLEHAEGFRYALMPIAGDMAMREIDTHGSGLAMMRISPRPEATSGTLAVGIGSSSDDGGHEEALKRYEAELADQFDETVSCWARDNAEAAQAFWSRSAVTCSDSFVEDLWYQTLHARRCAYRDDVVAPGLFLPSTLNDYSLWHGDYHTNYNYQSPFWGGYEANQLSLGDSYFVGFEHMLELGRKLAPQYFNCRGSFVQLTGFPFPIDHDPYGVGPFSRMSYMTGWSVNQYWFRWLYTRDETFLREVAYPAIRDAALFYLDFLIEGDDGHVHAFPSDQGEFQFVDDITHYMDRPQVVRHARYCLDIAVQAANILDMDDELAAEWADYASRMVHVDNLDWLGFGADMDRYLLTPPEFVAWYDEKPELEVPVEFRLTDDNGMWSWYFGHYPLRWSVCMRNNGFVPDRDYETVKTLINRWWLPNGLVRAMSLETYGFAGAWAESLGVVGPLMEMMLQSFGGVIRVFPLWPGKLECSYSTLRAEGAFLVSASFKDGQVADHVVIHSEVGGPCRLASPWASPIRVTDTDNNVVAVEMDDDNIATFDTHAGESYLIHQPH